MFCNNQNPTMKNRSSLFSNLSQLAILLLSISVLTNCRPNENASIKHKKSGSSQSDDQAIKEKSKAEQYTFESVSKPSLVDGKGLNVNKLSVSDHLIGSHHSLALTVETNEATDIVQFYICQTEDDKKCNPSKEAPGTFFANQHSFPLPPVGLVEVGVRSCTRAHNDISGKETCGEWSDPKVYRQAPNSDEELSNLLQKKYDEEQAVKSMGQEIRNNLVHYKSLTSGLGLVEKSKEKQNLDTLIENQLILGSDAVGELLLGDTIYDVELSILDEKVRRSEQEIADIESGKVEVDIGDLENIGEDKSLNLAGDGASDEEKIGSIVLMGIGSVAIIGGIVGAVHFDNEIPKFNDAIDKIKDSKIYKNSQTRVAQNFTSNGVSKEIELKKVDSAIKASESRVAKNNKLYSQAIDKKMVEKGVLEKDDLDKLKRVIETDNAKLKNLENLRNNIDNPSEILKSKNVEIKNLETNVKSSTVKGKASLGIAFGGLLTIGVGLLTGGVFGLSESPDKGLVKGLNYVYDEIKIKKSKLLELNIELVELIEKEK